MWLGIHVGLLFFSFSFWETWFCTRSICTWEVFSTNIHQQFMAMNLVRELWIYSHTLWAHCLMWVSYDLPRLVRKLVWNSALPLFCYILYVAFLFFFPFWSSHESHVLPLLSFHFPQFTNLAVSESKRLYSSSRFPSPFLKLQDAIRETVAE